MQNRILTEELRQSYSRMLQTSYSKSTKERYQRDVADFYQYAQGCEISPEVCSQYEEELKSRYSARSIKTIANGLNSFFRFANWEELIIGPSGLPPKEDLYREPMTLWEYKKLLEEAEKRGNWRLYLLMQTLCTLCLRVSEHTLVTREALSEGHIMLIRKESCWILQVPGDLRQKLERYCRQEQITNGPVFRTANGRIYDRSNIYRDMKHLCPGAGVQPGKVMPQQLLNLGAAKLDDRAREAGSGITRVRMRQGKSVAQ